MRLIHLQTQQQQQDVGFINTASPDNSTNKPNKMPPKVAKAAPAATEGGEERKAPTANEAFLFYSIIKHMKGKPEIDWASVASDAGLKNADTAKVSN